MTYHHLRAPLPAAAPPAARRVAQLAPPRQPGPVTMALRAMQAELTKPRPVGPVTAAIRNMRAADPAFDANAELRSLRRALADRIEGDIAVLDMLGGDDDLEGDEPEDDAGDNPEEENEHGSDEDAGEPSLCGVEVGPGDSWDREGGDIQDQPHDAEEDDDRDSGCGDLEGMLEQWGPRSGHYGDAV